MVLPFSAVCVPSPKSTTTEVIAAPVVGVAAIVKIVGLPAAGVCVEVVNVTTSAGFGVTVTLPVPVAVSPNVSNAVTFTVYQPTCEYVWLAALGCPVMVWAANPSPKSITTRATGLPLAFCA